MSSIPRLVVSAPSSGHGKTAVSVGLLAALAARGLRATGFKVGPDYVDAAYLGLASGRPGRNLDPRLVGANRIGPLFTHGAAGSDIAVVEGTMGLFDGLTSRTDGESTAQLAGLLRAPVVLVVDVGAMGQSAAALVHGFRSYDELLWLGGVVLTRVMSSRHERLLRESLADVGVPVLGVIKRSDVGALGPSGSALPPREHGLAPAAQRSLEALRGVRRLGDLIASSLDLERLLVLARSAPRLAAEPWAPDTAVVADEPTGDFRRPGVYARRPLVAVAAAYGYAEVPELLTVAGADVVTFDPLRDDRLPEGVDGLVVPGGLPEAYADQLSANERLRREVRALAHAGRPIVAEGAGLVWLSRELDGHPMCGVVDAVARTNDRYVVGYREASVVVDSFLHRRGGVVTGHKLHRTSMTPRAGYRAAWHWPGGQPEGYVDNALHASYLSVHWAGVPTMAPRFVAAAAAGAASLPPAVGSVSVPVNWAGELDDTPPEPLRMPTRATPELGAAVGHQPTTALPVGAVPEAADEPGAGTEPQPARPWRGPAGWAPMGLGDDVPVNLSKDDAEPDAPEEPADDAPHVAADTGDVPPAAKPVRAVAAGSEAAAGDRGPAWPAPAPEPAASVGTGEAALTASQSVPAKSDHVPATADSVPSPEPARTAPPAPSDADPAPTAAGPVPATTGSAPTAAASAASTGPAQTPSVTAPTSAGPSVAAPNSAAPSVAAPNSAAPSVAAPNSAAPSVTAPTSAAPSVAADGPVDAGTDKAAETMLLQPDAAASHPSRAADRPDDEATPDTADRTQLLDRSETREGT